jgi:uncharacterized membrane protein
MSPEISNLIPPAVIGAAILFIIGYIGNLISFSNRFMNAFVTAIVFAAVYGGLSYYLFFSGANLPPEVQQKLQEAPEFQNMTQQRMIQVVGVSAALVFVIDLIANMLSFSNRLMNAIMTSVVFLVLFGAYLYMLGGVTVPMPA